MFSKLIRRVTERVPARIGIVSEPTAITVDTRHSRPVREIALDHWRELSARLTGRAAAAQVAHRDDGSAQVLLIVDGEETAFFVQLGDRGDLARLLADFVSDPKTDRLVVTTNDWPGIDVVSTPKTTPPPPPGGGLPPKPTELPFGKRGQLILARLETILNIAVLDVREDSRDLEGAGRER